jgi:hypothetical protein
MSRIVHGVFCTVKFSAGNGKPQRAVQGHGRQLQPAVGAVEKPAANNSLPALPAGDQFDTDRGGDSGIASRGPPVGGIALPFYRAGRPTEARLVRRRTRSCCEVLVAKGKCSVNAGFSSRPRRGSDLAFQKPIAVWCHELALMLACCSHITCRLIGSFGAAMMELL